MMEVDDRYERFRREVKWDLNGYPSLWEVMADVPNFFPDEELEMQVVIARRVLQELYADGWMRLVRVNELGMPPEGEELGSPEVEEVIAKMAPHPGPPTGDNLLVQLVPTEKTETWIKKLVAEERGRARERGDDRR